MQHFFSSSSLYFPSCWHIFCLVGYTFWHEWSSKFTWNLNLMRLGCSTCSLWVITRLYAGFHFSRCSYLLSLLRPHIIRDLELKVKASTLFSVQVMVKVYFLCVCVLQIHRNTGLRCTWETLMLSLLCWKMGWEAPHRDPSFWAQIWPATRGRLASFHKRMLRWFSHQTVLLKYFS